VFRTHDVSTCWVVVERDGYSLHVTPYTTARLARLASERYGNPAATTTRMAAIGNLLLRAYRLPTLEWLRMSKLVATAVEGHQ
jgi:hypothetical protein